MNRKDAGFSLIELIATVSVLATLLAIALPSFTTLLQGSRASGTYHLLTTSLAAARLRAIKDNAPVTVCPSADGRSCRSDEVWSDGWIVYQDPGRDTQPQGSDTVIQRFEGVGVELQLKTTSGRSHVRLLPSGRASGSNLSIRLCRPGQDGFLGRGRKRTRLNSSH